MHTSTLNFLFGLIVLHKLFTNLHMIKIWLETISIINLIFKNKTSSRLNGSDLRWYWTHLCCNVCFSEINNKMKCNNISSFFPKECHLKAYGSGLELLRICRSGFESRSGFYNFHLSTFFKSLFLVKYCKI